MTNITPRAYHDFSDVMCVVLLCYVIVSRGKKLKKLLSLGLVLIVLTTVAIAGCGGGEGQARAGSGTGESDHCAAASLQDAAGELKTIYEQQQAGVKITYNFASSGTLQKQIEEGAPADLFISAGKSQMDALAEKGLIVDASRRDLLGNELVLITGKDGSLSGFEGLTDAGVAKIAVGTPETVPAGKYAQEALTHLGLWDKLNRNSFGQDVRQVLTYMETSNADAGLVYRSDNGQR